MKKKSTQASRLLQSTQPQNILEGWNKCLFGKFKNNRLTSGELLSNDRRAVGFVNSLPRFSVLRAPPLYPISEYESQMSQTKNRPSEKLHKKTNRIIYLLQIEAAEKILKNWKKWQKIKNMLKFVILI